MKRPVIESRNKREGRYAGRIRYCRRTNGLMGRTHHERVGSTVKRVSLREWAYRQRWCA